MNKAINMGIVGCGYWGPNLTRNFRSTPGIDVQYLCDTNEKRLSHMHQLYPEVKGSTDFEHLLNGVGLDAIAIATSPSTHFDLAQKSLLAGKHTFVEKPMAMSVEQCQTLLELAQRQKLTFMVGHTFIYSSPVRKIKQIVDAGDLGEILYISCQRLNLGLFQKDTNVIWDLAPHDLSIILYLLGESPLTVNCQGQSHMNPGIEDVTSMSLTFAGGSFASIQSSWLDPNKIRKMTIVGSRRMIVYDDMEPLEKIRIFDKRVDAPPHYDTFAEFQYSYHYGDMYSPYVQQSEPLKVECQHFLDCIKSGQTPESSAQDGLDVVRILEAASASLRQGGNQIRLADMSLKASK
jgi:predicted dehydrogenase